MRKIGQWVLAGIAILLGATWVVLLVGGADRALLQAISAALSVLGVLAGLAYQAKKREEAARSTGTESAEAAPQRELSSAAEPATSDGSGGDPLGRWWRRQE